MRRLGSLSRLLTVEDLTIVFAVVDAGIAFFLLSADSKPVWAALVGGAGLALAALSFIPLSERVRGLALTGAAIVLGSCFNLAFVAAHAPHAPFHDSALMTEVAATRLINGEDPYGHDYLHTFARTFYTPDVPVNFGLGHYVYPPVPILLDAPLRALSQAGGPDIGFPALYSVALAGLAAACFFLGTSWPVRRAALAAVALNPVMISDATVNFFNDVFYLAPIFGAAAALRHRRPLLMGALIGLALATKQQSVLFIPFLALGSWLHLERRDLAPALAAALAVPVLIVGPFLLWDPSGFAGDVAGFFYGSGVGDYPIRGASLPAILVALGVIPNRWQAFPSAPFQILVTLPALLLGLRWLSRKWSWPRAWLLIAMVAFLVFFPGRVLAPNYIDLVLVLLTLAAAEAIASAQAALSASAQTLRQEPPAPASTQTGGLGPGWIA